MSASKCTPEITAEICQRLADGESLVKICRDKHMPCRHTVNEWLRYNLNGFREQYQIAHEMQADFHVAALIEIADRVQNGTSEQIQAARLACDMRKWIAGKQKPSKYGDKVVNAHGGDPHKPIITKIEYVIVDPKITMNDR